MSARSTGKKVLFYFECINLIMINTFYSFPITIKMHFLYPRYRNTFTVILSTYSSHHNFGNRNVFLVWNILYTWGNATKNVIKREKWKITPTNHSFVLFSVCDTWFFMSVTLDCCVKMLLCFLVFCGTLYLLISSLELLGWKYF